MRGFELGVQQRPDPRRVVSVTFVNDDWVEVRLDGAVIEEGHEITNHTIRKVVEALGFRYEQNQAYRNIYTGEPVDSLEDAYLMPDDD